MLQNVINFLTNTQIKTSHLPILFYFNSIQKLYPPLLQQFSPFKLIWNATQFSYKKKVTFSPLKREHCSKQEAIANRIWLNFFCRFLRITIFVVDSMRASVCVCVWEQVKKFHLELLFCTLALLCQNKCSWLYKVAQLSVYREKKRV